MILQYNGLDTIGNYDEDYGTDEDQETSNDDIDMENNPHMEGLGEDGEGVRIEQEVQDAIEKEVQVGYAEKKSRMWVHYKCACERKEVRWLKRERKKERKWLQHPLKRRTTRSMY